MPNCAWYRCKADIFWTVWYAVHFHARKMDWSFKKGKYTVKDPPWYAQMYQNKHHCCKGCGRTGCLIHVRKMCARWVSHLQSNEQKKQCIKYAGNSIENVYFQFPNAWHMTEPQKRTDKSKGHKKMMRGPCVAKRASNIKKMLLFSLIPMG